MASSPHTHGRSSLVAAVAMVLGLFVVAPAEASFPGRNGVIAFVEEPNGFAASATVGAIAPSGRGYWRLIGESLLGGLSFSPGGGALAYSQDLPRPPTFLHLASSRGTDRREVPGPVLGAEPTWSPNGRELAFTRVDTIGTPLGGLSIVGVDGQGLRVLTADGRDGQPAFSSRGPIAFVRAGDLFVINGDGSGLRRLTRSRASEASPDFSPDGQRLVFSSSGRHAWGGSDIFTMSARGGPVRRLLRSPSADYEPVWSPDGRQVAFTSGPAPDQLVRTLGTVGANGRGYRTIRRLPPFEGNYQRGAEFSWLAWQPRR